MVYNTTQTWKIGDCLNLLPEIETNSIDMILTDLPYGTTACSWDIIIPFDLLWKEYKRIIKNTGAIVLTAQEPFATYLRLSNINNYKYDWIWYKSKPSGIANVKYKPMINHELICIFGYNTIDYYPIKEKREGFTQGSKDRFSKNKNFGSYRNHKNEIQNLENTNIKKTEQLRYPTTIRKVPSIPNRLGTLHPTQKPVELFEYLIKTYTNEGDTVHDSCLGSGTTLEACRKTNRNCIGFEISDEWEKYYPNRILAHNKTINEWF